MGHIPSGRVLRCLSLILLIFPVEVLDATAASEQKWLRISSDHFTVLTDGSEKQGREVAIRLEQMRWVFGQLLMKSKLKLSEPLIVIAFRDDKEYAQIAPVRQGQTTSDFGFFIEGEDRNYIVLNLFEPESWRAVSHPFAHLFLDYNYPRTQPWFDEGFAEYFSSLRVDNKQVQIGGDPELGSAWHEDLGNQTAIRNPPRSLTEVLAAPVWLAVPDLFTMKHEIGYQEGTHHTMFYAQSWMVMHYLLNKNKLAETGNYFDLVENQKLPVDQAIQQAYGVSVTQFDQAIKDYFHSLAPLFAAVDASKQSGRNAGLTNYVDTFPVAISADDVGTSRQDITEASARALVAEMALRLPEHRDQATHQLETLVNDPKLETPIARRALGWLHLQNKDFEQATEELNRALEIDPKDVSVH
ncbi:MAG: hypothetical protein JOY93_08270, partial [Acidobacteriales bacterium]|nr:hypothetical protein [Terriglobales bacterium]